jgi:hypothetical protein
VHVTIPLTNFAASPLGGNSSFYEVGIGLTAIGVRGAATVYFDNIQLARRPVRSPDIILNQFNTADEASQWSVVVGLRERRLMPGTPRWTPRRMRIPVRLKVTVDFSLAGCAGDNQFAALRNIFRPWTDRSSPTWSWISFGDPGSPRRAAGDFGFLETGLSQYRLRPGLAPPLDPFPPTRDGFTWILPIDSHRTHDSKPSMASS